MSVTLRPFGLRFLGDEDLRVVCTPVVGQRVTEGLVEEMRRVVRVRRGAGLAANQVGGRERVILVAMGTEVHVLINPRLTFVSPETVTEQEGCLSIPTFYTTLRRARQVRVAYLDEGFAAKEITLGGMEARCVQHEIDHLDGKLIVDGLPRQQRRQAERLVAKANA